MLWHKFSGLHNQEVNQEASRLFQHLYVGSCCLKSGPDRQPLRAAGLTEELKLCDVSFFFSIVVIEVQCFLMIFGSYKLLETKTFHVNCRRMEVILVTGVLQEHRLFILVQLWSQLNQSDSNLSQPAALLRLTAVNAEMLLQVVFVLEGFSTFTAFELAVSSSFVQKRLLRREKHSSSCDGEWVGEGSTSWQCGTVATGGI